MWAFQTVKNCIKYKDGADLKEMERELSACRGDKTLHPDLDPSLAKQRDLVKRLLNTTEEQIALVKKLYGTKCVDEDRKELIIIDAPPYLEDAVERIETNCIQFETLLHGVPEKLKSGRLKDDYFRNLVCRLGEIFIKFTGLPVKTSSDLDGMKRMPEFHIFAEECFVALGFGVDDGFEAKLHKTVNMLRSEGRLPRNRKQKKKKK